MGYSLIVNMGQEKIFDRAAGVLGDPLVLTVVDRPAVQYSSLKTGWMSGERTLLVVVSMGVGKESGILHYMGFLLMSVATLPRSAASVSLCRGLGGGRASERERDMTTTLMRLDRASPRFRRGIPGRSWRSLRPHGRRLLVFSSQQQQQQQQQRVGAGAVVMMELPRVLTTVGAITCQQRQQQRRRRGGCVAAFCGDRDRHDGVRSRRGVRGSSSTVASSSSSSSSSSLG